MAKKKRIPLKWILLALILPFLYLAIVFPFLQNIYDVPFFERAHIGEMNLFRIVFIYGFLTAITVLVSFWKDFLKPAAITTLICLVLGSSFVAFAIFSGSQQPIAPTSTLLVTPTPEPIQTTPKPKPQSQPQQTQPITTWGGPELWEAVNKRRVELGVNPLGQKGELCTIAAIRLSEIIELGKLDAHEGFGNMSERRPNLKWIFEKYRVYEFLISGVKTPEEAVAGWEHTLGHRSLLAGGEFVWGCIYAAGGFAVAIAAF